MNNWLRKIRKIIKNKSKTFIFSPVENDEVVQRTENQRSSTGTDTAQLGKDDKVGGIDLSAMWLDLQIQGDGAMLSVLMSNLPVENI